MNLISWVLSSKLIFVVEQTPELRVSRSTSMTTQGEVQQPPMQGVTWTGAPIPSISAEWGSTRIAVTIQNASSGRGEKRRVHGSTISLVCLLLHISPPPLLQDYIKRFQVAFKNSGRNCRPEMSIPWQTAPWHLDLWDAGNSHPGHFFFGWGCTVIPG